MYRKAPRFIVFTALFIVLTTFTGAAEKSFLWEVKSPTATVHLLGSLHLFKPSYYPLPAAIETAYKKSSNVVVEVNVGAYDPQEIQRKTMALAVYPGAETLAENVDAKTLKLLENYLGGKGIPLQAFMKYRPGMIAMSLMMIEMQQLGFSEQHGIDSYFMNKANADKKPIIELEKLEDQLDLLFSMPDNNAYLKQSILECSKVKGIVDKMVKFWRSGDSVGLRTLIIDEPLKENPEFKPLHKKLFDDRNVKMTGKIEKMLQSNNTYFVVVGAGHLVGEMGIVNLLQKRGNYVIVQK